GSAGTGPLPRELADMRGMLALSAGDPDRARTAWSESGRSGENESAIARRVAATYFVEGRLSEAADSYRSALASNPGQAMARYGLAICYLELGDAAGVVRECDAAVKSATLPGTLAYFCRDMRGVAEPHVRATAQRTRVDAGR